MRSWRSLLGLPALGFFTWSAILLVFAISFLAVVGWIFDITLFTNIKPQWITIRVVTAICLALSAIELAFLQWRPAQRPQIPPSASTWHTGRPRGITQRCGIRNEGNYRTRALPDRCPIPEPLSDSGDQDGLSDLRSSSWLSDVLWSCSLRAVAVPQTLLMLLWCPRPWRVTWSRQLPS